jgi:hypothetical protein
MGIDRWELEHRNYRPGRARPAEVAAEDLVLDVPEEIPVDQAPPLRGPKSPAAKPGSSSSDKS